MSKLSKSSAAGAQAIADVFLYLADRGDEVNLGEIKSTLVACDRKGEPIDKRFGHKLLWLFATDARLVPSWQSEIKHAVRSGWNANPIVVGLALAAWFDNPIEILEQASKR